MVSNCRKETVTRLSSVFLAPFFLILVVAKGFVYTWVCVISCGLSGTFVLVCTEVLGACKLIKCVNMSKKGVNFDDDGVDFSSRPRIKIPLSHGVALIFEYKTFPTNWLKIRAMRGLKFFRGCLLARFACHIFVSIVG